MKKLELKNFGVLEMNTEELNEVTGGIDWTGIFKGSVVSYIALQVVNNWSEIKSGFIAGYQAKI